MKVTRCDICGGISTSRTFSLKGGKRYSIYSNHEGEPMDVCPDCQKKYVDDYFYKLRCDNGLEPATPETPSSR